MPLSPPGGGAVLFQSVLSFSKTPQAGGAQFGKTPNNRRNCMRNIQHAPTTYIAGRAASAAVVVAAATPAAISNRRSLLMRSYHPPLPPPRPRAGTPQLGGKLRLGTHAHVEFDARWPLLRRSMFAVARAAPSCFRSGLRRIRTFDPSGGLFGRTNAGPESPGTADGAAARAERAVHAVVFRRIARWQAKSSQCMPLPRGGLNRAKPGEGARRPTPSLRACCAAAWSTPACGCSLRTNFGDSAPSPGRRTVPRVTGGAVGQASLFEGGHQRVAAFGEVPPAFKVHGHHLCGPEDPRCLCGVLARQREECIAQQRRLCATGRTALRRRTDQTGRQRPAQP